MKKHKMIHKTLSVLLSLVVMANTFSLNAFAAEPTQDTVKVPTIEGGEKNEDVKVSVSVTENENGTTTTKKETDDGGYQTESGLTVDYESSETTKVEERVSEESNYTVVNEDETYGAEGGSQTTVSKGDGTEGDITLGLMKDGETADSKVTGTSGTASTVTKPTNEDSKLKEEDPANFDQTTTTTTDRTADATISSSETTVGNPTLVTEDGKELSLDDAYSYFYTDGFYYDYSEIGKYIIRYKVNNEVEGEIYVWNLTITYMDNGEAGEAIGGLYCVDLSTNANESTGYSMVNLEDAVKEGYYSEAEAAKLRAIIKNGFARYDGNEEIEDNNANNATALKEFKEKLQASGKFEKEFIEKLTWEQATIATQMAIWQIANRVDGEIEVYAEGKEGYTEKAEVATELKKYLLTLEDTDTSNESKILSEDQSFENMELIIGSKNQNGVDDQHDLYNVGLKFSLVVTPGIGDELYVHVLDQDGKITVTKRIPTEEKDIGQDGFLKVVTGVDGKVYYIIDDLVLAENTDLSLTLKLDGTQNLEEGVYVFQARCAEDGTSLSQNMIRMYSGKAKIDLSKMLTMRFNVEEADVITTREWRKEWTKEVDYPVGPQDDDKEFKDKEEKKDVPKTEEKLTPTVAKIQTSNVVQNTTAPKTGDQSQMFVWMTLILMSGLVVCQAIAAKRKF